MKTTHNPIILIILALLASAANLLYAYLWNPAGMSFVDASLFLAMPIAIGGITPEKVSRNILAGAFLGFIAATTFDSAQALFVCTVVSFAFGGGLCWRRATGRLG